jgi:antitoxin MazE
MQSRVQKWGNSLALRIPKSFALEIGLADETQVEISLVGGKLIIAPLAKAPFTLQELLDEITPENIHHEQDTGNAIGTEAW